ncbi:hypothetical protein GCM10010251_95610 [Streptomyces aurantiogriseus]|uniref:Uncharacterized protein n=1 Tax=Streptomyces aurantiogriseus TaxID=66870 RepID=A0A918FPR2_9ACTN|nr:hypothetical protein GCM10010251_95610 [Streptomyces aurantiogriseus]
MGAHREVGGEVPVGVPDTAAGRGAPVHTLSQGQGEVGKSAVEVVGERLVVLGERAPRAAHQDGAGAVGEQRDPAAPEATSVRAGLPGSTVAVSGGASVTWVKQEASRGARVTQEAGPVSPAAAAAAPSVRGTAARAGRRRACRAGRRGRRRRGPTAGCGATCPSCAHDRQGAAGRRRPPPRLPVDQAAEGA